MIQSIDGHQTNIEDARKPHELIPGSRKKSRRPKSVTAILHHDLET